MESIRDRIINGLEAWTDSTTGMRPIRRIFRREEVYAGPYVENSPDLIVGCERGYRISWQTALGSMGKLPVEDNPKAWSGDHCADPELVPGVLLCNRPLNVARPRIIDIAPTIDSIISPCHNRPTCTITANVQTPIIAIEGAYKSPIISPFSIST